MSAVLSTPALTTLSTIHAGSSKKSCSTGPWLAGRSSSINSTVTATMSGAVTLSYTGLGAKSADDELIVGPSIL